MPLFGCIADNFTGASDVASFLVQGGLRTCLFNGIPSAAPPAEAQALVVSLKTRTMARESAVRQSLHALEWLRAQGCGQFYIKYCSTFDSTPEGNIGPVCDAALEWADAKYTLLCPALPVNGRTVLNGELLVNGVPLAQSPMRNHPLTPMWDSSIARLMTPQSRYPCIRPGEPAPQAEHYYVVPDCACEEDLRQIAAEYGNLPLLTGGSGLAPYLAGRLAPEKQAALHPDGAKGPALLIAGSCSQATREQIECYRNQGGVCRRIDPAALLDGTDSVDEICRFIGGRAGKSVLVYSSDEAENIRRNRMKYAQDIPQLLESVCAQLAQRAVAQGFRRLIIAGGETSGAVMKALGYSRYAIGGSVAPGVPVMTPLEAPDLRVVLKSGNFGQRDFFLRALKQTEG